MIIRTKQDIENATFEEAFELFFERASADRGDGWVSPLCLCRQELQDCFVGQIVGEDHIFDHPPHRLFASAMVALSGIELMARMIPPPPKVSSGELFLAFVAQYSPLAKMKVSDKHARVLLDLRNALSHTFGLYSLDEDGNHQQLFVFSSNHPEELVRSKEDGGYEVCLEVLVRLFIRMVEAFRVHLWETPELQRYFMTAFHKYGRLFQRGPHVA
ncbi:MAG TPA: hypothetical protein VFT47_09515 [Vicinamibacterales bacterium]|nr:hypothetical protein [Vicinamibacterales bacterium]